ncbi:NAD(P)/FAD-dependent oxidoreductase [Streptomyces sp. NPDC050145]|uniref:NAD(P)/FAD-dependent oxidoreductase n=1 Tax=Streptomyces sp. NPDC050145 TaxID=3365602 RepID=UPI0037BA73C1
MQHIVVVGGGASAISACETLRHEGFAGQLTLVSAESGLPYDRPPLSKQVLSGQWGIERIALRSSQEIDELGVTWLGGRRATSLDPTRRVVGLDDGRHLVFDGAIIATGVSARQLPFGAALAGIHVLRTGADARALQTAFESGPRVVVVGAGLIGSEVAATARKLGLDVTLVDPEPVPLMRQLGRNFGESIAQAHRANGVALRMEAGVRGFTGGAGRVTGVELDDGTVLPAECVLVAIGSVPATEWLASSGLTLDRGALVCDQYCQAAPDIYAAGDVAAWQHPGYGRRLRVEHRTNATEQGRAAALNLLGAEQPFSPVPYFWTDQYDIKIQGYGLLEGEDVELAEGSPEEGRFVAVYRSGGKPVGLLGWNSARRMRHFRPLLDA